MAGPSPVSALIHAATMVTAGLTCYQDARALCTKPGHHDPLAIIGAVTLLVVRFQRSHTERSERVLAYSTISQIGYMFLAMASWPVGCNFFIL